MAGGHGLHESQSSDVSHQRADRTALHEVTQIWLDEQFVIPIAEGASRDTGPEVTHAGVRDVSWDPFALFGFDGVWLQR